MKPSHKKYIFENAHKKSIREIAEALNLKEKNVRKIIKEAQRPLAPAANANPKEHVEPKSEKLWIYYISITLAGFFVYANVLASKFLFDDIGLIQDNVFIKNFSLWPKLFTQSIWAGAGVKNSFFVYRPLQMSIYLIDYHLWRLNPLGYHLTNIMFHVFAALVLFRLILTLFGNRTWAALTAFLFVVHPIHTEAVAYCAGLADPLVAFFLFLSLLLYVKALNDKKPVFYWTMGIFYLLALLSKEYGLVLLALVSVYHYVFKKRFETQAVLVLAVFSTAYIVLRFCAARGFIAPPPAVRADFFERLPGVFVSIAAYLRLLLFPVHLHMEYGASLFSLADPAALLGCALTAMWLIYTFRSRNKKPWLVFSTLWFFLALVPVSNLFPINAFMAEHWLYVPSVGFFLIAAKILTDFYENKSTRTVSILCALSILTVLASLTVRQNYYWKDAVTFYNQTLKYTPDASRDYNNVGVEYKNQGKTQEAITAFQKAIEIYPKYVEAYNNLGSVYQDAGQNDKAIEYFSKAVEIKPDFAAGHHNLAIAYYYSDQPALAANHFKKAKELGYPVNEKLSKFLEAYLT